MDSNHRNPKMTDLQSVPFNHSGTYPYALSRVNINYNTENLTDCQVFFFTSAIGRTVT